MTDSPFYSRDKLYLKMFAVVLQLKAVETCFSKFTFLYIAFVVDLCLVSRCLTCFAHVAKAKCVSSQLRMFLMNMC